ncbi:hypothetical protein C5Z26_07830 [Lactobacillus sp. CBA3606]|uniref:YczE/YyaS/YitT family protein n=1 Tax=Lactobacillus sp. CBA3606 TaxID=2099789 RepID=UPI000CFB30E2|nr:hypothetical protein [Lactobacillus sp. CBA3606]AVK64024.1 hypothetical protein C5Z26_07830 [Lactobacillus sp. CBA3606]
MVQNTQVKVGHDWVKRWFFLGLSLLINSIGHALTIVMNLGSAVWTASAVNLYHLWPFSLSVTLFSCGVVVVLLNTILIRQIIWSRIIGNLLFTVPFSYLIQLFTQEIQKTGIRELPVNTRVIIDVLGILCVALATSMYQRANLILHPNDDFMQIIRFRYLHGNATIAQIVHYIPPVIIMVITYLISGQLWAVNIGTIICLFFQGTFIGFFDRTVFINLKHYGLKTIKK